MYCHTCACEFVGWTGLCPVCKTPLARELPPVLEAQGEPVSYEALVGLVRERGGQLKIDLATTDVGTAKNRGFPYLGYGTAWARRMQADLDSAAVDVVVTEVGMDEKRGFPYSGYRFAWAKRLEGDIGGNPITLTANKVAMDQESGFPYTGYGFAWTQGMSGECGDQLRAELQTTEVGREKERRFPYFGYGLAWAKKGVLTLSLKA